ncbi:dermonecrotic toxin domain-containing protein [Pseudomonas monteilii]|uniref:dermonecrotic toxin domain-containing protein n=1 Tax=Pseudomonas monteilii TaxID=76759 RepID=UPI00383B6712
MATTHINAAGVQFVRNHLATLPRPDREAKRAIAAWLATQGVHQDPDLIDVVTLHVHPDGIASYQAKVVQRVNLTQAVLMNWQGESNNDFFGGLFRQPWAGTLPDDGPITLVDHFPPQPIYDNGAWYEVFNGLFKRSTPARYDHSTLLDIRAEALQSHIEALDFHTLYKATLDTYWREQLADYRLSCKLNFIAACNKQVNEGSLSDAARMLAWRAAELIPQGKGLRLSTLSIYGYASTDLLYINDAGSGLTLLYAPGNSSPLLEFASEDLLKDWVGQQCKGAATRQALKQHFRLADGPQGIDFSGLDTALEGLGVYPHNHRLPPEHGFFNDDGTWPPRTYVNYRPGKYNPRITGDLFQAMAERMRQRCYDDADFLITSDAQVTKARWRGYLVSSLNLLAPLALVVPELVPLLAIGGVAQFGLGLDQAINGKNLEDKDAGVSNIVFGLLNATPLATLPATRPRMLFPGKSSRFVMPTRLNDQWGYPLGPDSPPRLPDEEAAGFFTPPEPTVVATRITRGPLNRATGTNPLLALKNGNEVEVLYDTDHDAFIVKDDANEVSPAYYQVTAGTRDLYLIDPASRPVSDAMRMYTLRRLGVDLKLPLRVPLIDSASVTSVPKKILSIWVGDKSIPDELLENIANNAKRLKGTGFSYELHLSKANPQVFKRNLAKLSATSDLQVHPLEEQPFFTTFKESEYYHQYQQAIEAEGANFSSASDILRYPLLHSEGGVYMDVDDTLLNFENNPKNYTMISAIDLKTTPDGLVLGGPVSNELLGMHCDYNTNMIASHAGNPTLSLISETMHQRFLDNLTFYDTRPLAGSLGFETYAQELSRMTGPGMLNDVVAQHLPRLQFLRQLSKLESIPETGFRSLTENVLVPAAQARNRDQALSSVATIGNYHSWSKA